MSTINFPHENGREPPIYKPSTTTPTTAAFIFIHGLADSAAAIENVADQFQQGGKLPYMSWILPNAKRSPITLDTAWFTPNGLPSHAPSRPELIPDEDEEGMLESVAYIESIVDAVVETGLPPDRIIVGGFSQGCATSLLTHLTSRKYSGKLAGCAGLLGWLPLWDGTKRVKAIREEAGLQSSGEQQGNEIQIFLARGGRDEFVPKRAWVYTLQGLKELGIVKEEESLEVKEYPPLTHTINAPVLRDLCQWMEKVLPPIEG
ncbi:unnamed protein product [Cercospora beticola]|nr:unnamed protein product [Cercospora beticola]